jgi:hypothetical protein
MSGESEYRASVGVSVIMKASIFRVFLTMIATAVCALPSARGADTTAASNQPATDTGAVATPVQPAAPAVTQTPAPAPVKLPYGVDDVLKLSRAQISEDVVVNYVHNSGTVYNLEPNDIVYLRNQGVSDRVINAMMDQRTRTTAMAAQTVQPAPVLVAPTPDPNAAAAAQYPQPAPTYVQAPADAQAASGSSLYVIPYPAATTAYYGSYAYYGPYSYYGYYPYYYPYYRGYCGPVVSFGFGYHGGHGWYHGGGYHGGYHGHH